MHINFVQGPVAEGFQAFEFASFTCDASGFRNQSLGVDSRCANNICPWTFAQNNLLKNILPIWTFAQMKFAQKGEDICPWRQLLNFKFQNIICNTDISKKFQTGFSLDL